MIQSGNFQDTVKLGFDKKNRIRRPLAYLGVRVLELQVAFQEENPHFLLSTTGHWTGQVELTEFADQLVLKETKYFQNYFF